MLVRLRFREKHLDVPLDVATREEMTGARKLHGILEHRIGQAPIEKLVVARPW